MYEIKFEGASSLVQAAVNESVPIMNTVVDYAASGKFGSAIRIRWFMADSVELFRRLKAMKSYLHDRCTRLTFVVKALNHRVDQAVVMKGDFAQVIGSNFVSSGTRIFILPSFPNQTPDEKLNTICHELSHRVLDTTDYPNGVSVYGSTDARALDANSAIICAENWGYFYMEMAQKFGLVS